jgi:hypothetical protein
VTPQARSSPPFELLRFEAAPISSTLVVLELEGRFRQATRFARAPVLVVEPGGDARRIELSPVRTAADGARWQAAYAAPVEALSPGARLSLGVRGTLVELPAPDEPDDGERLTTLARETNRLRRRLEAAETETQAARADADAARAELATAVTAARDEAVAASAERIDALEREVVEAHRLAASDAEKARAETDAALAAAIEATTRQHQQALTEANTRAETAEHDAEEAQARARAAERQIQDADARAAAAEQRATEVAARLTAAHERVADLEALAAEPSAAAAQDDTLTAEMAAAIDAQARAQEAEQELRVAKEGIEVLRAELAEERERAQAAIAEREAANGGSAARADEDETQVVPFRDDADLTRPFSVAEQRDADDDATQPFGPRSEPSGPREATLRDLLTPEHADGPRHGPNLSRWIAVAALILFALILIGLLAGFLG